MFKRSKFQSNSNRLRRLSLPFLTVVFGVVVSQQSIACDLPDFDKEKPAAVTDQTNATSLTHFNWGSDVDPWGPTDGESKAWHFVENLHDRALSLVWEKAGILIPFDRPIAKSQCRSAVEYGPLDAFEKDYDAPIFTGNDGEKKAIAFVKKTVDQKDSRYVTGTQILAEYFADGVKRDAVSYFFATYVPAQEVLTIEFYSGEYGEQIAFNPKAFGLDAEYIKIRFGERGIDHKFVSLDEIIGSDEMSVAFFSTSTEEIYVQMIAPDGLKLVAEDVDPESFQKTEIMLLSPFGDLLMAKTVSLDAPN